MEWKQAIYGKRDSIRNELRRLEEATLSQKNKELLRKYHRFLVLNNCGEERVVKLSCQMRKVGELLGKDFDEANREDIENVVQVIIQNNLLSNETKIDYKRAIKQFYKWLRGTGDDAPPEVSWIKRMGNGQEKRRYLGQTLLPNEIEAMIKACDNVRDKALISFVYETGARVGEILSMCIGDFMPDGQMMAKVRLNGKTGERVIPIVTSVPYISQYLTNHPFREDTSAALWLCSANFNHNKPLKYVALRAVILNAAFKAGIRKKVNPHFFRHSRATELSQHLTEVQLDNYFGWEIGSKQPGTYIHASSKELKNPIMKLHNIQTKEQEKEEKIQRPLICGRCDTINGSTNKFCSKCGCALTVKVALEVEAQIKEETNKTVELLMEIMKNPELLKRFEEFKMNYKD